MRSTSMRISCCTTLLSEPLSLGRTKPHSSRLSCCECRFGAPADHLPFALSYGSHDVQHHTIGRGYVAGSDFDAALH